MYQVTIIQKQGKNSEFETTEKLRIHGNFLELRLVGMTKFIALNGVEQITEIELPKAGEAVEGNP